jgi:hypothetical protein
MRSVHPRPSAISPDGPAATEAATVTTAPRRAVVCLEFARGRVLLGRRSTFAVAGRRQRRGKAPPPHTRIGRHARQQRRSRPRLHAVESKCVVSTAEFQSAAPVGNLRSPRPPWRLGRRRQGCERADRRARRGRMSIGLDKRDGGPSRAVSRQARTAPDSARCGPGAAACCLPRGVARPPTATHLRISGSGHDVDRHRRALGRR